MRSFHSNGHVPPNAGKSTRTVKHLIVKRDAHGREERYEIGEEDLLYMIQRRMKEQGQNNSSLDRIMRGEYRRVIERR
jgi:hypothetical protein